MASDSKEEESLPTPTNRRYRLPPARTVVKYLDDQPRIVMRDRNGAKWFEAFDADLFVELVAKHKHDQLRKFHESFKLPIDLYIKDELQIGTKYSWFGQNEEERETNKTWYTDRYNELSKKAKAYLATHPPTTTKKRGRKRKKKSISNTLNTIPATPFTTTQIDSTPIRTAQIDSTPIRTTQIDSTPIHNTRSVRGKLTFNQCNVANDHAYPSQSISIQSTTPPPQQETQQQTRTINQIFDMLCGMNNKIDLLGSTLSNKVNVLQNNMNILNNKMDYVVERVNSVEKSITNNQKTETFDKYDELKKSKHKLSQKAYYQKNKTKPKQIRKDFTQLTTRFKNNRVKDIKENIDQKVGMDNIGLGVLCKYLWKYVPEFKQYIIDFDLLNKYQTLEQKKLMNKTLSSLPHMYHELWIMVTIQQSASKYVFSKHQREYKREYIFNEETQTFSLSRPKSKDEKYFKIMVDPRKMHEVLQYMYNLNRYRSYLIPKIYNCIDGDGNMVCIPFVPPVYLLRHLLYTTYTHKSYLNNTSLLHSIALQKWFNEDILKLNDDNTKYIIKEKVTPRTFEVKGNDIYITGKPLIVVGQYDGKGHLKCCPNPHLNHLCLSIANILPRGLVQASLTRTLGALGNISDNCSEWITFLKFYFKNMPNEIVTVIFEHGKWTLHMKNEFILILTFDLSAHSKAYGSIKESQFFLVICRPGKASKHKPFHSFAGDLYEFEYYKNHDLFEKLPQIPYFIVLEMKESGKTLPVRFITEFPPNYRRKIDSIIIQLKKKHKQDGLTDEQSNEAIKTTLWVENHIPIIAVGVELAYDVMTICGLHTGFGLTRSDISLTPSECLLTFKTGKDFVCDTLTRFNKFDPSLKQQIKTLKNTVRGLKATKSVSLSVNGDVRHKYGELTHIYNILYLNNDVYKNGSSYIANKAGNHYLSYYNACVIKILNIYTIDNESLVFKVIFKKMINLGRYMANLVRRLFPGKIIHKWYVKLALTTYVFKIYCILLQHSIGPQLITQQGSERIGKILGDNTKFTDGKEIKSFNPNRVKVDEKSDPYHCDNDDDEDDDIDESFITNYIQQLYNRFKIKEFGDNDHGKNDLSKNVKNAKEKQDLYDKLIEQQHDQLTNLNEKQINDLNVWNLKFFEDENRFFNWRLIENEINKNKMNENEIDFTIPDKFKMLIDKFKKWNLNSKVPNDWKEYMFSKKNIKNPKKRGTTSQPILNNDDNKKKQKTANNKKKHNTRFRVN